VQGCIIGQDFTGDPVNQIGRSKKRLIPIFQGHEGVSKKSETHLHNVVMFTLGSAILLMDVGTRDLMGNVNVAKKGIKLIVLPTPVRLELDTNNFAIKSTLNKVLKLKKILEHLRLRAKQIKPSEFTIIIYEVDLIFLATERINHRTPHIQKISYKGTDERLEDTKYGNW
jgi:hypothetical protein